MKYLLDTAALSEPMRKHPNEHFMKALKRYDRECVTCSIVWSELRFGVARLPDSVRKEALSRYLTSIRPRLDVLGYDDIAAEWHAEERARLERLGKPPPFADGQIAAIAATRGLVVVTANKKDFERFHVKVESWW